MKFRSSALLRERASRDQELSGELKNLGLL